MALRFWDMDHTLIDNDCDVSWKTFMIDQGLAAPDAQALADEFFAQYERGELDVDAFLDFQLAEFAGRSPEECAELAQQHFEAIVKPRIYPDAVELLGKQRAAGDHLVLLTATNAVIAKPLADYLHFQAMVATELELADGAYTGRLSGPYCGGAGKVTCMQDTLNQHSVGLDQVWYYGDSVSDIPVLEAVGHPVVCNPDEDLASLAIERGWQCLTFARPAASV